MLGLRADPSRISPSSIDSDLKDKENHERKQRLAALDKLLDRGSGQSVHSVKSPRKDSLPDGSERPLPANPSTVSSTRTPSPASSAPHSYSSSTMEKELGGAPPYRHQLLGPVSSASSAAAERERARASSVNSQNAPPVIPPPPSSMGMHPAPTPNPPNHLSHLTASRDRDTPTHAYPVYGPHPQPSPAPQQSRPSQSRRQSTDIHPPMLANTGSLSKSRATNLGMGQTAGYPSGLTRTIRAMQEVQRVS